MKRKITSSQPQQDKPDFYVLKRAFIAAFNETGDRYRIAHYNTIENRSKDHKINMRSWNLEKSLVPPIVEETIDGFKVYDMLYLSKPLYRKIELMAQLKEQSFMSCLIWMAEQNVEAVLDNNEEMGSLIRKRILEEAYGLGGKPPIQREKELKEALESEKQ